jgi:membrane protein DedA with SNARE-associated domain
MVARIIEILSGFIVATISALGYSGVVLLMAIESACIPLPSEIIMPFSGYLVYTGRFNLWAVGVAGAFGCVVGSLLAYWVGLRGGRPLIESTAASSCSRATTWTSPTAGSPGTARSSSSPAACSPCYAPL